MSPYDMQQHSGEGTLLFAPESFWAASPEVRAAVSNGCGAKGGWKIDLVPDTMWGLDISFACDIHDWMYAAGESEADKRAADRTFLNNLLRIIEANSSNFLVKALRRRRALKYYWAVKTFGGPAFWAGKNPPGTEKIVPA